MNEKRGHGHGQVQEILLKGVKYLIVQSLVPGRILRAAVQKTERPQAVVDRNDNNIAKRSNHPSVVDHREDGAKFEGS